MNREQVNAWRVAQGLTPIVQSAEDAAKAKARKRAANANKAAHAALQKQIRDMRSRRSK